MSTGHVISLELTPELYEQVQNLARISNRSPESALLDMLIMFLNTSPLDIESHLAIMERFSAAQLWKIIHEDLPGVDKHRLNQLIEKGKQGQLPVKEQSELEHLLDRVDYQVLLRSKALAILKERGYDVEGYLKQD